MGASITMALVAEVGCQPAKGGRKPPIFVSRGMGLEPEHNQRSLCNLQRDSFRWRHPDGRGEFAGSVGRTALHDRSRFLHKPIGFFEAHAGDSGIRVAASQEFGPENSVRELIAVARKGDQKTRMCLELVEHDLSFTLSNLVDQFGFRNHCDRYRHCCGSKLEPGPGADGETLGVVSACRRPLAGISGAHVQSSRLCKIFFSYGLVGRLKQMWTRLIGDRPDRVDLVVVLLEWLRRQRVTRRRLTNEIAL